MCISWGHILIYAIRLKLRVTTWAFDGQVKYYLMFPFASRLANGQRGQIWVDATNVKFHALEPVPQRKGLTAAFGFHGFEAQRELPWSQAVSSQVVFSRALLEHGSSKRRGIKGAKIVQGFPKANVSYRQPQFLANGDDDSTFGGSIQFGQY